jgi:hypothetical protein
MTATKTRQTKADLIARNADLEARLAAALAEVAELRRQTAPAAPKDTKTAIRTAYARLVGPRSEFVALAALRADLAGYDRADVDRALLQMARERGVHIHPLSNLKALTQADRDAALWMGGQDNHAIAIES